MLASGPPPFWAGVFPIILHGRRGAKGHIYARVRLPLARATGANSGEFSARDASSGARSRLYLPRVDHLVADDVAELPEVPELVALVLGERGIVGLVLTDLLSCLD